MEVERDVIGMAFLFWALEMAMIWRFMPQGDTVPVGTKIIISVVSIPMIYGVILWQKNR